MMEQGYRTTLYADTARGPPETLGRGDRAEALELCGIFPV